MKTDIHMQLCLGQFFLEWEMLEAKFVEKIKTHSIFMNVFPIVLPFMRQ